MRGISLDGILVEVRQYLHWVLARMRRCEHHWLAIDGNYIPANVRAGYCQCLSRHDTIRPAFALNGFMMKGAKHGGN